VCQDVQQSRGVDDIVVVDVVLRRGHPKVQVLLDPVVFLDVFCLSWRWCYPGIDVLSHIENRLDVAAAGVVEFFHAPRVQIKAIKPPVSGVDMGRLIIVCECDPPDVFVIAVRLQTHQQLESIPFAGASEVITIWCYRNLTISLSVIIMSQW